MRSYNGKLNAINRRLDRVSPARSEPPMPTMTREELRARWINLYQGMIARLQTSESQDERQAAAGFEADLARFKEHEELGNPFGFTKENLTRW